MSNTPRTDFQAGWAIANQYGTSTSSVLYADTNGVFVHAAFARELERENARLRDALTGMANMPEYDQDDAQRLRNLARLALVPSA